MRLPIIVLGLILITGQAHFYNGFMLEVTVALSAIPIAFLVILPAALYKLEQDLANTCWVFSSLTFLIMQLFFPFLLTWLQS